ncbi:MAG: ribosome small subunit-dependent GTPase A [Bacilli bacterium]|nr:ribosome small subunit-dependent GTPase A [Bacilli bacterium]
MKGRIIKVISNDYTVKLDNDIKVVCKPRGVFRNINMTPFAGDIVEIDEDKKIITKILDRKNKLNRPPVCNIDCAIIVTSTINPSFSTLLLDKMINIIEFNNIKPLIVVSKSDLYMDEDIKNKLDYYKSIGYDVFLNNEIEKIKESINGKTVILTGQTGVGKSSLLNKMDSSLDLKTNEISKALGRGKHTTRAIEFYEFENSLIADTPGFSSLSFYDMTKEDIRDNFIEFNNYRDLCKYRDCMHIKEDDCIIKEKVNEGKILLDRYNNYISFIKEKENEGISFNIKGKR